MHANIIAAQGVVKAPTIAIAISFNDRDGNRAKATCYCPVTASEENAWLLAMTIADRMQAFSDGVLFKVELTWKYRVEPTPTPPEDSTVERKLLLLVTNEDEEINGMIVPSPGDVFESTGAYAGIRLDLASAGAIGFADMLLVVDLQTSDDRSVGTTLAAGGLAI